MEHFKTTNDFDKNLELIESLKKKIEDIEEEMSYSSKLKKVKMNKKN